MTKKLFPVTVAILAAGVAGLAILLARANTALHARPASESGKNGLAIAMESGAGMLQPDSPISAIHQSVCGFHFYSGQLERQITSFHYCSHLSGDVLQCVIYDSNRKDARLIGIEYIIGERLFVSLTEGEKKFWHSHQFEVMSGQLVVPGATPEAETEIMRKLVNTYGKTWHMWQIDRGDRLPLGIPQLMMGFTADGQANPEMITMRDQALGISTEKLRDERAHLPAGPIAPGANAWQNGEPFQLRENP